MQKVNSKTYITTKDGKIFQDKNENWDEYLRIFMAGFPDSLKTQNAAPSLKALGMGTKWVFSERQCFKEINKESYEVYNIDALLIKNKLISPKGMDFW